MADKNCKFCYGKGYSTRVFHEIGSPDFPGDKGFASLKYEKKPCRCQQPFPIHPIRKPPEMRRLSEREIGRKEALSEALRFTVEIMGTPVIPARCVEELMDREEPAFIRKCVLLEE